MAESEMLYLTEDQVQKLLSPRDAVEWAHEGFLDEAQGRVVDARFYLPIGQRQFLKPSGSYRQGDIIALLHVFGYFPQAQPTRPATSSLLLLWDVRAGQPAALVEANWLTALKTAAASTVVAQHLARPGADTVAIFGVGQQGRMHLQTLAEFFALRQAWIVDVNHARAVAFARQWGPRLGFPIWAVPYERREEAVRAADMVITVTTANEPMLSYAWLKPGALVIKLGSYQELAPEVLLQADRVVVDRWDYVAARLPEVQQLVAQGLLSREQVVEWPDVLAGRAPGRQHRDEIIVYLSLGLGGEFAAIAAHIYERARALRAGAPVPGRRA
ncbi:MAG: ornithine cyclodeaminase family protein [Chloroflexi bacterium]|nr:ornithine cyclodeaminase family protein [Chloroflexota bacterium]